MRAPLADKVHYRSSGRSAMIHLTRINHVPLVLNSDLIEQIEAAPDTIVSLTNGQKLVVLESIDDIVQRVIDFRRLIAAGVSEDRRLAEEPQGIEEAESDG